MREMPAPRNLFKAALQEKSPLIGFWLALADAYTAEICAGTGYDWLLIDGEHGPNDLRTIMHQLQALKGSKSAAVVRPVAPEPWMIKQLLDVGAQTLLVPMIESAAQAREMVSAVRYAPEGKRGVGAALARASDFNRIPDYLATAGNEICLLLQIESRAGLAALDEIVQIEGVDGVFIGPADLAADLGHRGDPAHSAVQQHVEAALHKIMNAGKPAGILTSTLSLAGRYVEMGARFVAIGSDVGVLARGAETLCSEFRAKHVHHTG